VTDSTVSTPRPADPQARATHGHDPAGYRPALDGIRAIAVGSVVAYHFGFGAAHGGFLGVDVFFVLSGYLITSILLSEYGVRGHISLPGFYLRRLRRLFPALALVVLAVLVGTALYASPLQLSDRFHDMIAALFYYANWHFIASDQSYFAGLSGASPLRHTWSLSIEEQFYFVWPLLLLVLLRFVGMRRRALIAAGLAVATLASAAAMAATYNAAEPSRAYYGSDGRAQQLLVGVLLAVGLHGLARREHAVPAARVWTAISIGSLLSLLYLMHRLHDTSSKYYYGGALIAAVVTAVLIAGVERHPGSPVGALLSVRPIVWVGKVSYGIYLWHWPVLLWVDGTIARILVTVGVSAASFYLVEKPIRTGRVWWVGKSSRRTALAFAVVVSLVAGTAYAGTRPPSLHEDKIAAEARVRALVPCKELTEPCVRVAGPAGAPVVASIGDSTMEGYDTALRLLGRSHGFTYIQAAVPGCPLSIRPIRSGPKGTQTARDKLCEKFTPHAYTQLVEERNTQLFIGTAVREFLATEDDQGRTLEVGSPEHLAVVRAGLEKAIAMLTKRGATVVLLHILPRGAEPDCLSVRTSHQKRCTTLASADKDAASYNAVFDAVAAEHPDHVKVIDFTDLICPDGRCPVTAHGLTLRGDQLHLTHVASAWIAPYLYDRIKAAGIALP
jgi:peptidoglycan/LPS O-acetylase OafA/YrhL